MGIVQYHFSTRPCASLQGDVSNSSALFVIVTLLPTYAISLNTTGEGLLENRRPCYMFNGLYFAYRTLKLSLQFWHLFT